MGVVTTANRSAAALSRNVTTPFVDPFVGLKGRDLRDGETYTEKKISRQSFMCFIFPKSIGFSFCEGNAQCFPRFLV